MGLITGSQVTSSSSRSSQKTWTLFPLAFVSVRNMVDEVLCNIAPAFAMHFEATGVVQRLGKRLDQLLRLREVITDHADNLAGAASMQSQLVSFPEVVAQ